MRLLKKGKARKFKCRICKSKYLVKPEDMDYYPALGIKVKCEVCGHEGYIS